MIAAMPRIEYAGRVALAYTVCSSAQSLAIRAIAGAGSHRPLAPSMVANRLYRRYLALAVLPDPDSTGRAMVERSQFLPWFLRACIFRLRDLAGTLPASQS